MISTLIHGDLFDVIPTLGDQSINAVITSPPYADQRKQHYGGIPEKDYAAWTVRWMETIRPKLTSDGNVAIVIRPHVRDGGISDYVLRTRLAIREAGWNEVEELIWIKPTSAPVGHINRPRRSWESILWFSRSRKPFCDTRPDGIAKPSNRIGFSHCKSLKMGLIGGNQMEINDGEGVARVRDYVEIGVGEVCKASWNTHPAQYPERFADWLIRLLSPLGGVICDPFAGSGTTLIAAQKAGRGYLGTEIRAEYVEIAERRLRVPSVWPEMAVP